MTFIELQHEMERRTGKKLHSAYIGGVPMGTWLYYPIADDEVFDTVNVPIRNLRLNEDESGFVFDVDLPEVAA